ncbi:hypothetical protein GCM10027516_14340 [Niabella aquatica]
MHFPAQARLIIKGKYKPTEPGGTVQEWLWPGKKLFCNIHLKNYTDETIVYAIINIVFFITEL